MPNKLTVNANIISEIIIQNGNNKLLLHNPLNDFEIILCVVKGKYLFPFYFKYPLTKKLFNGTGVPFAT
jgi:hypothetical protein